MNGKCQHQIKAIYIILIDKRLSEIIVFLALDEKVTVDYARREYGVVVDKEKRRVDGAATKELRRRILEGQNR